MKKTILLACTFLLVHTAATAQVSKSDFISNVNWLNTYINQKSVAAQTTTYSQLAQFMSGEISYLKGMVKTSAATYTADTTRVHITSKTPANPNQAALDKAAAQRTQTAYNVWQQYKQTLDNDNVLFSTIRSLVTNMTANQAALIADLNRFAATL